MESISVTFPRDFQLIYRKNINPDDDPNNKPVLTWRAAANNLYTNWLNYYVYQATPYDLEGTPF